MEIKFYILSLIIINLILAKQSLLVACPTYLYGTSFIHHSEDAIGEMEVFQSEEYEQIQGDKE